MAITFTKPTVGASTDTWGTTLNGIIDDIADYLDGTTEITPNLTAGSWSVSGTAVTATAAELNKLDGLTASTAELNRLDGMTATASELNRMDGITASTTELNYTDGVTSNIQTQLNGKVTTSRTISAGGGLTGGGSLSANRTISHADTSSQSSVNNSGNTVIQDITLDGYGHVTSIGSKALSIPAAYTDSQARAAQKVTAYVVGQYMLIVSLSGSAGAFNGTSGGGNLAAASCSGHAYRQSSSVIYSLSGSWRRMGYQESSGSLTAQPGSTRTTLWVRYA